MGNLSGHNIVDFVDSMTAQVKTVLLYDHEKNNTSIKFTKALETFIPELQYQDFEESSEEEKHTLPILAVVRSTTLRVGDEINETAEHLKGMLVALETVIVVYFDMEGDESLRKDIASNSDGCRFSKVIYMDFSGFSLQYPVTLCGLHIFSIHNSINTSARKGIQLASVWSVKRKTASVDVYYINTSCAAEHFLEEVGKLMFPKFQLQRAKYIDMLTYTNLATVIYTTSPLDSSILKDWRNVVIFRIFELDEDSNNGIMDDKLTQGPKPTVPQKLVEFYNSEYTEREPSQFGLYFNILLGNARQQSSCSLTILKELETFITERNKI